MTPQDIASKLKEKFGDKIVAETLDVHDPFCQIDPMSIAEVCAFMKNELGFNYLRCLSGVDYMDKKKTTDDLGVIYHLGAVPDASLLFCLKVILPRVGAKVATVENVWSTADWHEREAWDMFGIDFVGHHNQTRILCAEDWVGHALRKDYKSPDEYHGIKNNVV